MKKVSNLIRGILGVLTLVFAVGISASPQHEGHDMSKMPGMSRPKAKSKSKITSRKNRKVTRRKQTAGKRDMNKMPGMNMPGMKMSGMHRRKAAPGKKKTPSQKSSANKAGMGNMPGMNMPAKPASSSKQSAAPQSSPQP